MFLLSVGISRFSHPEINLKNAEQDARSVAALMSIPTPPVYDRVVTRVLLNESATVPDVLRALSDIAASAGPDDLVLIFFAGHGEQVDGKFYFAPSDFGSRNPAAFERAMKAGPDGDAALDELFRREGLGQDRLLPVIQAMPAARVAIILDSCFSGSLVAADSTGSRNSNLTITNSIGHASGRFVLSGATRDALDSVPDGLVNAAPDGHGPFTSLLLRALEGDADFDHEGRIDVYKVAVYTKREVERATAQLRERQEPAYFLAGTQFFDLRAVAPTH